MPPSPLTFCFLRRIVGYALLACLLSLAGCHKDPQVQKRKFYDRGVQYIKEGKLAEAKLQFLNALRIDQSYAEAACALAEIDFRERDFHRAFALLQQAVKAKPEYLPTRKGLAQLYRLSGRLPEAQQQLEFVLSRTPDDVETQLNLGILQRLQGHYKDAKASLERVLKLQPSHVGAFLALASLSRDMNDLPAAEQFLKTAHEQNPRSVPVYLALFKFYIISNRKAAMEPLFAQALKDTGNNVEILQAQDGYYEGSNRLPEAEAIVRKIHAAHSSEPAYWGVIAEFYIRTNDWTKAKAELERILQQHKDDMDSLHKLIEVHLNMNGRHEAESMNAALLRRNPLDSYCHLFKGRMALADGKLDVALVEFAATQKLRPEWPALHFWLAQTYIRRNELPSARHELETALAYDPEYRTARVTLASLQNQAGLVSSAIQNARHLLLENPRDVPALLVFSESMILNKDYDRAAKVMKIALEGAPNSSNVHRQLGILALIHKDLAVAHNEFRLAWALEPSSKPALQNLILGYVVQRQGNAAIDFLQQAIRDYPNAALLYVELARIRLWAGHPADAIPALQTAVKLDSDNLESYVLLADVYASSNRAAEAEQLLASTVQKTGMNADLLVRSGAIFERLHSWDKAREAYEHALQIDNTHTVAKNNLAWVLAEHGGDLNVALTLAQQAADRMVGNPDFSSTLGWICYKRQLYSLALNNLQISVSKDANNATFQYQIGMIYWKLGRMGDAARALQNALELDPQLPYIATASAVLRQLSPASPAR